MKIQQFHCTDSRVQMIQLTVGIGRTVRPQEAPIYENQPYARWIHKTEQNTKKHNHDEKFHKTKKFKMCRLDINNRSMQLLIKYCVFFPQFFFFINLMKINNLWDFMIVYHSWPRLTKYGFSMVFFCCCCFVFLFIINILHSILASVIHILCPSSDQIVD